MKRRTRYLAGFLLAMVVVAGCSTSNKASDDTSSAVTFTPTTTTLPIGERVLTVKDLPRGWVSAGGIDYQSVFGDQPQRCFYDLDQLDSGSVEDSSASFKIGSGLPMISEVAFSFQVDAAAPAVATVAKALDGCGDFAISNGAATIAGSVTQSNLDLHGLSDLHVYSIDYHNSSDKSEGMILLGRNGESVLLTILGTGATPPKADTARELFQMAIDKFTSGTVHNEDRQTA